MAINKLLPAAEVVALVGWKNRSSLTRAVQRGRLIPKFTASGDRGEQFFDLRDVERFIAKREVA